MGHPPRAHLGGPGYGQVKLGLLNEILGRSVCAPIVFGCQAPDSGNSEILAHYGTPELKERYLEPLLDNRIVSAFSMTEPQGGADPKVFTTTAALDGDEWVINGEKWFSSFASLASFLIVMAVTDPDAAPYERHSMFVVPAETPGINLLRTVGMGYEPVGGGREGYVRYENVRVPPTTCSARGRRLRGGPDSPRRRPYPPRHAHRGSRPTDLRHAVRAGCVPLHPGRDARQQADGPGDDRRFLDGDRGFRLLTLQTAWKIDQHHDYKAVRADISAVKAMMQKVLHDVSPAPCSSTAPSAPPMRCPSCRPGRVVRARAGRRADRGPQGHAGPAAPQGLQPAPDLFPSEHLPRLRAAAEAKFADQLSGIPRN